jgi:hypothetical protein
MFGKSRREQKQRASAAAVLTIERPRGVQSNSLAGFRLRHLGTTPEDRPVFAQLLRNSAQWENAAPQIQPTAHHPSAADQVATAEASALGISDQAPTLEWTAAARAYAPLSIATVERIFRNHGWKYAIEGGRLLTRFSGVPMVITIEREHSAVRIVVPLFIAEERSRGASRTRADDVDTFLSAVNYVLPIGAYVRDVEAGDIYYLLGIRAPGGNLDEEEFVEAIAHAVKTVLAFGPMVEAMVQGRLSLDDALQTLKQALTESRSSRRAV